MIQSVPVCMFHHVNENAKDYITVSIEGFSDMMAMLSREGYTTLSSEEFRQYMLGLRKVPRKSVLLTFDDGWLDVFVHAFPIMEKHGHKFTVFVISDWVDKAGQNPRSTVPDAFPLHEEAMRLTGTLRACEVACCWEDLKTMLAGGLCSVENHTAGHGQNRDVRADIEKGRRAIQSNLGVPGNQLCWPFGRHSAQSLSIAKDLGIDITYLVRTGVNLSGFFASKVKRFTVKDHDGAWLKRHLELYSRPLYGYLYSRVKPYRIKEKWFGGGGAARIVPLCRKVRSGRDRPPDASL